MDLLQFIVDYLDVDAYAYLGGAIVALLLWVFLLITRESAYGGRFVWLQNVCLAVAGVSLALFLFGFEATH